MRVVYAECVKHNGEFAGRGTHLYAHDFALPLGFLLVWRGIEKKYNNKTRELLIYFTERFKISTECVLKFLSRCYNLVLWYEQNKKYKRTFCCVFLYRAMFRGNQHSGSEYHDFQNWLDLTSRENPLLLLPCLFIKDTTSNVSFKNKQTKSNIVAPALTRLEPSLSCNVPLIGR